MQLVKLKNSNDEIPRDRLINLDKSFNMFMLHFLDNVKELFDSTTGSDCASCIKIIIQGSEGKVNVKTFMRDTVSYRKRSQIDIDLNEYPHEENTAFRKILSIHTNDNYFLSNNLKNESSYENINKNYICFYNACIVVPIRIHIEGRQYLQIGFLCVDNHDSGFSHQRDLEILQAFGDLLFIIFELFNELSGEIQNLIDQRPKNGKN